SIHSLCAWPLNVAIFRRLYGPEAPVDDGGVELFGVRTVGWSVTKRSAEDARTNIPLFDGQIRFRVGWNVSVNISFPGIFPDRRDSHGRREWMADQDVWLRW